MFLTALLFGIFHLSLHRFPGVFLIGIAACFVVWISGSIFTGMLLHALCNGFVSLISVYPHYDFIGITADRPSLLALLGAILIVAGVWLGVGKSPERSAGIPDNLSRTP